LDDENNSVSFYVLSNPSIDAFMQKAPDNFTLRPELWSQVRAFTIKLILSDL
jgi:hypothetical protein